MDTRFRRTLKALAAASMTAGLLALGAAAAEAHVTVAPNKTEEGSYAQLTFSVPNESETAKTSRLEVQLPTDRPFNSVSVKPVEGWKAEVVTEKLPQPVTVDGATVTEGPVRVVWTADEAHQIGQDEFQTFTISVGVLPKAGTTVTLPALQTYTDGTVVAWADAPEGGHSHGGGPASSASSTGTAPAGTGEESSHPAPVFTTTAKTSSAATASATAGHDGATTASDTSAATAAGWAGLAAGLLGLGAGVIALARTRTKA